jgi:putative acetyltransferase
MRLMESALPKLRAMQVKGSEPLDDSAYDARFGFLAHAGLQLPGGMPGRFNAAA